MSQHTGKALWCAICRTRRTEQELERDYQGEAVCPECGQRL